MKPIISCKFNMDTACVELKFLDGTMIFIDTIAVEDEVAANIEAVKPILPMPNLPVARVMWRAMPDLTTGVECWIIAGGAHHTVLSYDVTAEMLRDWARMLDIEFVHITKDTTPEKLEEELLVKDLIWKLK